jgi:hypothetical protein
LNLAIAAKIGTHRDITCPGVSGMDYHAGPMYPSNSNIIPQG